MTASNEQCAVHETWDGRLWLVHIMVVGEDGDGFPFPELDRWAVEVRAPVSLDESEAPVIAQVSAFTFRSPEALDDLLEAFELMDGGETFAAAVQEIDSAGGTFFDLFEGARDVLDVDDLLVIDEITVDEPFVTLPGLIPAIVNGLRAGPAGRRAAFVLAIPNRWNVPIDDVEREALQFAPWAETDMAVGLNADAHEIHERAGAFIASHGEDGAMIGSRADDLWLREHIDHALQQPMIAVPFDLPPALPAHIWAGAPEDVHEVHADADTGSVTIETLEHQLEVVGIPGNAPQLVGASLVTSIQTQAWLRAVHQRWWEYQPALHERVHEVIDQFLGGGLTDPGEDVPHLHMPNLRWDVAPWPASGAVSLAPLNEDADPWVFHALLDDGDDREHIGAVIVHDDGHVRAFLHDEWRPEFPDHEAAVQHLLGLGADQLIAAVLHNELDMGVTHVLLTGDVIGH